MRILLADAHCCVRDMLSACCLMMGDLVEAVYSASNPSEAVYRATALDVDVVVIEIAPSVGRPLLGGVAAIRTLRNIGFTGRIVSVSSPAYEHLAVAARDAGSSVHLCKPFLLEDFMRSLSAGPAWLRRTSSYPRTRCAP
ncbi:MAG: hypothetical protein ACM3X4_08895 [Ignavibacteriales bacterium]